MNFSRYLRIFVAVIFLFALVYAADVEVIAVHFGNPEYAESLRQDDYPGFSFYTTDGSSYYYGEDQKLIGNYNYLRGYYGEVPEKMGFAANYTDDKMSVRYPSPIYVVGANGVIMNTNGNFGISSAIKKVTKGKYEKLANKREYLKKTPIGERSPYRKAKINSKMVNWMAGWEVPDITVYDAEKNEHSLKELTKDKNVILVFYTMDGVLVKRGGMDGVIKEEYYNDKIRHPDEIEKEIQDSETPGAFFKSMAKAAMSGDDRYAEFTAVLEEVKELIK